MMEFIIKFLYGPVIALLMWPVWPAQMIAQPAPAMVLVNVPFQHELVLAGCDDTQPEKGCGDHGSGDYQGGGYEPVMVMGTVCLTDDIWREVAAGGGNWDLNFAYPHLRANERIVTVNGQCVTRRMPIEYDTLAAAYIRCTTYTGVVAASVADARRAYLRYKGAAGAPMVRRPDMNQ